VFYFTHFFGSIALSFFCCYVICIFQSFYLFFCSFFNHWLDLFFCDSMFYFVYLLPIHLWFYPFFHIVFVVLISRSIFFLFIFFISGPISPLFQMHNMHPLGYACICFYFSFVLCISPCIYISFISFLYIFC
jgi:hypothetical protein